MLFDVMTRLKRAPLGQNQFGVEFHYHCSFDITIYSLNRVLLPVFHLLDSLAVVVNPSYRKLVRNAYLLALAINLITCTGKQYLPQKSWMGYM